MRSILTIAIAMAMSLAAPAVAQLGEWTLVAPEGTGFRVEMPGAPQLSSKQDPQSDGYSVLVRQWSSVDCDIAYVVSSAGEYRINDLSPDAMLDRSMYKMARNHQLVSHREFRLDGHPAREFVINMSSGLTLAVRSALVGRQFYLFVVSGRGGIANAPQTRRFLESVVLSAR